MRGPERRTWAHWGRSPPHGKNWSPGPQPAGGDISWGAGDTIPLRNRPPQVKKLVYVYLVRYAEEQQDLALLSISTFQRGLKVRGVVCSPVPEEQPGRGRGPGG